MNFNKIILKASRTLAVLLCCILLVSCFEDQSSSTDQESVSQILEDRDTQAVSYARSIQQYSALVMQNLMLEARANDMQLQDMWTSNASPALSPTGLIDIGAFANMNNGRMNNELQAAYCNGAVYTWIRGNEQGEISKLKGLGEGGSEKIGRVLSKQLGSNGYGIFKDGQVETASGGVLNLNCEASRMIPEGTPVLFNTVANMDMSSNGTTYQFTNEACPGGQDGFIRMRTPITIEYDSNGEIIEQEQGEPEVFLNACMDSVSTVNISVTNMPTVSVVDFAAQGAQGEAMAATKEVVCFEAEMVEGEGVNQNGDGSGAPTGSEERRHSNDNAHRMTNCQDPGTFETSLPDNVTFTCGPTIQPNTTESQQMACTGNGWSGTVDYEREVEYCLINGGPDDGQIFEKKRKWERVAVDCSRNESQTVSCPYGAGMTNYRRVNRIIDPVTLAPTNPDWNYINDNCSTDEVSSCIGGYAGNRRAFTPTTNGSNNPPNATTGSMAQYCGSGSLCTVQRVVGCGAGYVGNKSQRSSYICGAGWGSWADHNTSGCKPIICNANQTYTGTASCDAGYSGVKTRTRTCNHDGTAYGGWSGWNTSSCASVICTANSTDTDTQACGAGYTGNQTRTRTCNGDGTAWGSWSGWNRSSCSAVPRVCHPGTWNSDAQPCGAGYTGSQTRRRLCNSTGTAYGGWSSWDRSSCVAVPSVCTPNTTQTDTQACGAGYTGNQTRTRTCNGAGTAWGGWSGWNRSSCTPVVACTIATATEVASHTFMTELESETSEDGCHQDRDEVEEVDYVIENNGTGYRIVRTRYYEYSKQGCNAGVTTVDNNRVTLYTSPNNIDIVDVTTDRTSGGGGAGGDAYSYYEYTDTTVHFYRCP